MTSAVRQPVDALIREAASIFHRLGGMATKHLTIVGGLVPPLLVPGAAAQHLGSADLDLCLSIALAGGETANYYESIEEKLEPYFGPCLVPADSAGARRAPPRGFPCFSTSSRPRPTSTPRPARAGQARPSPPRTPGRTFTPSSSRQGR